MKWIAVLLMWLPAVAFTAGPAQSVLYKCIDPDGVTSYTSTPRRGCIVIGLYGPQPASPAQARTARPASPQNYSCTSDCSGHRAGYEWARNRGISDAYQCTGNSQSFIEGCQAFTEGHPGF